MRRNLQQFTVLFCVILLTASLLVAFQVDTTPRQTTILYNAQIGSAPSEQGLSFLALGLKASQSFANDVTTLDTMPEQSEQAGYFITETIPLDRSAGYEVLFTIQIQEESHTSYHRAGFSVIVLSDDLLGIELGFWANEIWAQEGGVDYLFTHAEGVAYNTTSELVTYRLIISEDAYTLMANESPILSGPLRDYTAFDDILDPYETPNFLFLGDNTSSARTRADITYVALATELSTTDTPIPTATSTVTFTPMPIVTATVTPPATATPLPTFTPQSMKEYGWWRQCTSGYPPK